MILARRAVLGLSFAALAAPALAGRAAAEARPAERTIRVGPVTRHYLELVPPGLGRRPPVLVVLHGGTGSMRDLFGRRGGAMADLPAIARAEGMILVAPNGTSAAGDPAGDRQTWNDLRDGRSDGIDDVGFLTRLVGRVVAEHRADAGRVCIAGASNGGMMTYRMLIEAPDLFAAAAAFVANLPAGTRPVPRRPVPLMIMNGTADPLMPWDGGPISGDRGRVTSTAETVRHFVRGNGLSGPPRHRPLPDRDPGDGCRMVESRWDGAAPVVLVTVEGGGHRIPWPGAGRPGPLAGRVLGPACRDAHGLRMAWDFMKRFRRT